MTHELSASHIRLKRVYEPVASDDGVRVLVDRLWPRGLRKADAAIDRWMKDIAPRTELRRRFGHDSERWPTFHRRYSEELLEQAAVVDELRESARDGTVTLVSRLTMKHTTMQSCCAIRFCSRAIPKAQLVEPA